MHRTRPRQRGATLLEILTATAIMAIVLGIGVPNLVRLRAPHASIGAARRLAADLQVARLRAISRNTSVRVVFADAAYRLERQQGGMWVADGGAVPLPPSATIDEVTPAAPVFDSRGMLAAPVTITVGAPHAQPHVVAVNVLGHATID